MGEARLDHGGCTAKGIDLVSAFDAVWIIVGENRFTADFVVGCNPTPGEVVAQAFEIGQVGLSRGNMQDRVICLDKAGIVEVIQYCGKIHIP